MEEQPRLAGVLPVLQTPLTGDDAIDWDRLSGEVDWAFQVGADGVCCAMVSEMMMLTQPERDDLARRVVESTAGRGPVVTSVGAESTLQAVNAARRAEQVGCRAVMAIPPTRQALNADALVNYFDNIVRSVQIPVIVQDASSYVGRSIPAAVCRELLDRHGGDRVLFKPEANPVGTYISSLRQATGGAAQMFDGSGGIYLIDAFRRGVVGTMPGVDLLDAIVAIWRSLVAGDEETAYRIYLPVCALVALQMQAGLDGFLAIEKYLLVKRGIFQSDDRRRPCGWHPDRETLAEVDRLFDRVQEAME